MPAKRIITCIELDPRGDPVSADGSGDLAVLARVLEGEGADELVLDARAVSSAAIMTRAVRRASAELSVPLLVLVSGSSLGQAPNLFAAGADTVLLEAIDHPTLVEASNAFGADAVGAWLTCTRENAVEKALVAARSGIGQIALELRGCGGSLVPCLRSVSSAVHVPVLVVTHAPTLEYLRLALAEGRADGIVSPPELADGHRGGHQVKQYLAAAGISVRGAT